MRRRLLARLVNPRKYRREQLEQRIAELRHRDGDACARCRRPMRFDLPAGHDRGARIEAVLPGPGGGTLDTLCLTHGRCNVKSGDNTGEITERVRRKAEAELFVNARARRRA